MNGDTGGGGPANRAAATATPPDHPLPPQARELDQAITTIHTLITERPARDPLTVAARALLDALTAVAQLHYPVTIPTRTDTEWCAPAAYTNPPAPTIQATEQVPWPCGTLRALMNPLRAVVSPPSPTGRSTPRPR